MRGFAMVTKLEFIRANKVIAQYNLERITESEAAEEAKA